MLSTLQRIASMMDAEEIDAAPVLTPGVARAAPEDVSRYLKTAVSDGENDAVADLESVMPQQDGVLESGEFHQAVDDSW